MTKDDLKNILEIADQLRKANQRIEFLEKEIKRLQTPEGVAAILENLSLSELDEIGVTVTY